MSHEHHIRRCLEIAEEGRGRVGTGARVGAVLVCGQSEIARGVHRAFGQWHAERDLLMGFSGRVEEADTLYVNLEPCCPSPTKKTPPCTDIIVERGVRHLVYGMRDPDERVSGRGIDILQKAGIHVEGPILPEECADYNRGFVTMRTKGRPWITLVARSSSGPFPNDAQLLSEEEFSPDTLEVSPSHLLVLAVRNPQQFEQLGKTYPHVRIVQMTADVRSLITQCAQSSPDGFIGFTSMSAHRDSECGALLRAADFVDEEIE